MLVDDFGRTIDYLRVSVTDQCDLRCQYCRPSTISTTPLPGKLLTTAEITAVVQAAALLGITKVRLTGGEPLLRHDIVDMVASLSALSCLSDISLTTNALHLEALAPRLAAAGLRRVNVSLDTLKPERFARITGAPALPKVLNGITAAKAAGLQPVKINTVVMRAVNDDEVLDFAARTLSDGWHVRFIEVMPIGQADASLLVTAAELRAMLPELTSDQSLVGSGPARTYRLAGAKGTISIISPVSEHFCSACNRLRLTADGKLRPCLLDDGEVDLLPALRNGSSPDALAILIRQAIANKPKEHLLAQGCGPQARTMSQIGG